MGTGLYGGHPQLKTKKKQNEIQSHLPTTNIINQHCKQERLHQTGGGRWAGPKTISSFDVLLNGIGESLKPDPPPGGAQSQWRRSPLSTRAQSCSMDASGDTGVQNPVKKIMAPATKSKPKKPNTLSPLLGYFI